MLKNIISGLEKIVSSSSGSEKEILSKYSQKNKTSKSESSLDGSSSNKSESSDGQRSVWSPILDKYNLIKYVGKGSFSTVMKVQSKDTGKYYAVKLI